MLTPSDPLTNAAVTSGEDGDTIQPTLAYLHRNGIGGIVGYSAESDVPTGADSAHTCIELVSAVIVVPL